MLSEVMNFWYQLLLLWGTALELCVLYLWLPENSMYMAI